MSNTVEGPETLAAIADGRVLAALLEQLPIGVIVAAHDGRFEYVNPGARMFLEEHHRSRTTDASLDSPANGFEPVAWIIARALLTGEVVRDEEIEYLAGNEWHTVSVSATPLRDDAGEISRAVVTFSDVTARNRAHAWEPLVRSLSRM